MEATKPSWLDRALGAFGDVRAGESGTVFLLFLNLFLLLAGYYVAKTVREPLILFDALSSPARRSPPAKRRGLPVSPASASQYRSPGSWRGLAW